MGTTSTTTPAGYRPTAPSTPPSPSIDSALPAPVLAKPAQAVSSPAPAASLDTTSTIQHPLPARPVAPPSASSSMSPLKSAQAAATPALPASTRPPSAPPAPPVSSSRYLHAWPHATSGSTPSDQPAQPVPPTAQAAHQR